MNSKIKTGRNFAGALIYDLKKNGAEFITSNLVSDYRDIDKMSSEMREISNVQASTSRVVHHVSLSANPLEHLSDAQWIDVAKSYMKKMGFEDSQFVATRHTDTKIDHIHLVVNRVTMSGKLVSESNEKYRANQACAELEKELGLIQSNHSSKANAFNKTKISISDKNAGTDKVKALLINRIDTLLEKLIDSDISFAPDTFAKAAKMSGIDVQYNKAKNGSIRGVSYKLTDSSAQAFSGGKLRKDLTLGNIKKTLESRSISMRNGKAFTAAQKSSLTTSLSKLGITSTSEKYGMKLKIGNWNAVVFDNRNSLTVRGFPDPKLSAQVIVQAAQIKGWSSIKIEAADASTHAAIKEIAAEHNINIDDEQKHNNLSIKDVLTNNSISDQDLSNQQQSTNHSKEKNKGVSI